MHTNYWQFKKQINSDIDQVIILLDGTHPWKFGKDPSL